MNGTPSSSHTSPTFRIARCTSSDLIIDSHCSGDGSWSVVRPFCSITVIKFFVALMMAVDEDNFSNSADLGALGMLVVEANLSARYMTLMIELQGG